MKEETNQSKEDEQFIRVDYRIACIPNINSTDKLILGHILNFDTPGGCFQFLGSIGQIIAMSEDSVSKSVKKLIRLGYLPPEYHPVFRRKERNKMSQEKATATRIPPLLPKPTPFDTAPKARGIDPKGVGSKPKGVGSEPKGVVLDPKGFVSDPKGVGSDPTPLESKAPDLPMKTGSLLDSLSDSSSNKKSDSQSDHKSELKTDSIVEQYLPRNLSFEDIRKRIEESKKITASEALHLHIEKAMRSSSYYNNKTQDVEGIIDTDVSGGSLGHSLPSTQGSGPAAPVVAPTVSTTEPIETPDDIFANLFICNDTASQKPQRSSAGGSS